MAFLASSNENKFDVMESPHVHVWPHPNFSDIHHIIYDILFYIIWKINENFIRHASIDCLMLNKTLKLKLSTQHIMTIVAKIMQFSHVLSNWNPHQNPNPLSKSFIKINRIKPISRQLLILSHNNNSMWKKSNLIKKNAIILISSILICWFDWASVSLNATIKTKIEIYSTVNYYLFT